MSALGGRARSRFTPHDTSKNVDIGTFTNRNAQGQVVNTWWGKPTPYVMSIQPVGSFLGEWVYDRTNPGPPYLTGGPFLSIKLTGPKPNQLLGGGTWVSDVDQYGHKQTWSGGFLPLITIDVLGAHLGIPYLNTIARSSNFQPDSIVPIGTDYRPEVYGGLRPRLETAGAGVFLAEARDLPRMMRTTSEGFHNIWTGLQGSPRHMRMQPQGAANQFLNAQFGWAPFTRDVHRFFDTYYNSQRYIDRITRRNGLWSRRKRTFEKSDSTTVVEKRFGNAVQPFLPDNFYKGGEIDGLGWTNAYHEISTQTTRNVWAEGSFKYYRPEFDARGVNSYDSSINHVKRQMTLYGLRVTPSIIYQATPWSWLVDWFSNVGDVVERASDWGVDSIVAKYMYLMTHQTITTRVKHVFMFNSGPHVVEYEYKLETKQRQAADTPYGFGLSTLNLSDRQITILAALGSSRRWII